MKKSKAVILKEAHALVNKSAPPAWVPAVEDTGTAMFETGQELLLVVDDILIRFFGFEDPAKFKLVCEEIQKASDPADRAPSISLFHDRLQAILTGVQEYEQYGPDIITPEAVKQVGNIVSRIAETRLKKNLLKREGKQYPMVMGAISLVDEIEGLAYGGSGEYTKIEEPKKQKALKGKE